MRFIRERDRIRPISMRLDYGVYISLAVVLSGALAGGGCDRRPAKRVYTEVRVSPPAETQARPAFSEARQRRPAQMTAGDPHALLSDMPMDEIHAGLGGTPQSMGMSMPQGAAGDQTRQMLEASVTRPPLSWETPQGWQDQGAGGMRLATFRSADTSDPVECALISLAGDAGGLESNAARWMQQVNIVVPEAPAMGKFLAAQEKIKTQDGFDATILDLTPLQPTDDLESPSMAAAIIVLPDMTVFVKMTGSRGAVLKNKDKFESLCRSIRFNEK